jgi:hypothetical protein
LREFKFDRRLLRLPVKFLPPYRRFHGLAGCIANTPSIILQTGGGFGRRPSNIAGFERRSIDNAA